MTGNRRLTKSLDTLNEIKQNTVREFPGILGATFKGQTLVEVPSRSGYVYVRLRSNTNEVIQAFNETVSPVYDLPVVVIRDMSKNRYYVKSRDLGQYSTWGTSAYLPRHGAQHSFPDNNWGGDITWVYDRQFMPLLVSPTTGSNSGNVYVYPDIINNDGSWQYAGGSNSPSLLTYKPTDNQALLVLAYIDVSGTVRYTPGSSFSASYISNSQIIPYIPSMPSGAMLPLAAIRLVSGTSSISWNEIYDLRPIIGGEIFSLKSTPRWEDLRVPMTSTKLGGSKDPGFTVFKTNGAGSQGVFVYWFDASSEEELYFSCQLHHSYKQGTAIYPHVHWTPSVSGSAGQVVSWGIEYTWSDIGSTFGNTSLIYANAHSPADSILLAGKHYMTSFAPISGSGKTISSMLVCRVFRDATGAGATDSYTQDAGLLEIDFHFEMDTIGSKYESAK